MPDKPPPAPEKPELVMEFMSNAVSFAANVGKAAARNGGESEEGKLIEHNAQLVKGHFQRVAKYVEDNYERLGRQDRLALNEFLELTGGPEMVSSGEKVALERLSARSVGSSVLNFISEYLTEIKKLIGWILGLFNGGKPPKWWTKLEQLIDEIWRMLLKILGGIFGIDTSQLAREMSQAEVNYLEEQAAVARLQAEYDRMGRSDDD